MRSLEPDVRAAAAAAIGQLIANPDVLTALAATNKPELVRDRRSELLGSPM